jgi:RNA polymerase sigma-70 factor (ECF subfamily)
MTRDAPDLTLREQLAALHEECWGWALACCHGARDTAEEVLHMSYHKVLDGRACHDGRSAFKTWLFSVIRHTALDYQRWSWRWLARFLGIEAAAHCVAPHPLASESMERAERCGEVRAALSHLAARQAEVLRLVFYHNLTLDDAAAVMGISPGSARQHYERGKTRLRHLLGHRSSQP